MLNYLDQVACEKGLPNSKFSSVLLLVYRIYIDIIDIDIM